MITLERRYRRLLRAYPRPYRRERGEEILSTVLENTPPGRRWPTLREGRALLAGGMRVRSGLNQRLTMAANLRLAAALGLAFMLLQLAVGDLRLIISWAGWHHALPGTGQVAAYLALTLVVLAAAFLAPRPIAVGLACVAAALWFWWDGNHGEGSLAAILLVMLAALLRGKQRLPRVWLCLPGSVLALHLLAIWGSPWSPYILMRPLTMDLWWVILGCVVLWIVVDPRPAIAAASYIVFLVAEAAGPFAAQPRFSGQIASYAGVAVTVTAVAIWQLHRETPADIG